MAMMIKATPLVGNSSVRPSPHHSVSSEPARGKKKKEKEGRKSGYDLCVFLFAFFFLSLAFSSMKSDELLNKAHAHTAEFAMDHLLFLPLPGPRFVRSVPDREHD